MLDRIALGTAQFGLDYGINNKRGKIQKEEAFQILDYAYENGITTLDTAYAYGDSEIVIGDFLRETNYKFKIISKINNYENPEFIVQESLKRLNQITLYGFLVHNFSSFKNNPHIYKTLKTFKDNAKILKIGFSLYYPHEIDYLFENNIEFDIAQIPYSIFDQRFEEYFAILKTRDVDIYVRSVFLQGLYFMNPKKLDKYFIVARNKINKLHELSKKIGVSIASICLNFVLLNKYIDKVVIGVDNLSNFTENISIIKEKYIVRQYYEILKEMITEYEDIILPFKWPKSTV